MTRLNEKQIIQLFYSKLGMNTTIMGWDDVVALPFRNVFKRFSKDTSGIVVLKSDMLVESTDVPPAMRPWQVARKSVVACVSDMSAKGVNGPYLCLISIGIPSSLSTHHRIADLIKGFQIASKEFNVKMVGGDTNESRELIINCSFFRLLPGDEYIPKRKGAKPGDILVSSGLFGYSSCGLRILMNNAKAKGDFKRTAIRSVLTPEPQQKFGTLMAKYFSSSIDSSDGLAGCVHELATRNQVNIIIDNTPSAKGVEEFACDNNLAAQDLVFYGGEEYEIIATVPEANLEPVQYLSRKLKLKLYVIGKVEKGDGKVLFLNERGRYLRLRKSGYVHRFDE